MSSKVVLELELQPNSTQLQAILSKSSTAAHTFVRELINLLEGLDSGSYNGAANCKIGAVAASKTGTFTGAPSNNETVTVNGVVFTAKTSGATGDQFNIGGTVTASAANLAAAINASTTAGILDVVGATSALGVVTFYSKQAGKVGNAIPLAEALSNFTVAAANLSGGTQDTNISYVYGLPVSATY